MMYSLVEITMMTINHLKVTRQQNSNKKKDKLLNCNFLKVSLRKKRNSQVLMINFYVSVNKDIRFRFLC